MSTETLANEEVQHNADPDRYEDLADDLFVLDDVDAVSVDEVRTPPHVRVSLATANVTPHVEDVIDEYGAVVVPNSLEVDAEGCLTFDLVTPELFRPAGVRTAREYGPSSVALTFTREALELSRIDADDEVDVRAREGAILLTTHE